MNGMTDWYRVGGLATWTLGSLAGIVTEIVHLWKVGF